MKKILIFIFASVIGIGFADAAVRDSNAIGRAKSDAAAGTIATARGTSTASSRPDATTVGRGAINSQTSTASINGQASARTTSTRGAATTRDAAAARSTSTRTVAPATIPAGGRGTNARAAAPQKNTAARAATDAAATSAEISDTRTGAAYEVCKEAYFTCMDQFCKLKNDDYRRCSCSDRVYELTDVKSVLGDAGAKLTEFTEGLDAVGMTAQQAKAMKSASEGENALTADGSASKALLQAIMNSIRGGDTNIGGKYSGLNSINISFDTTNAFGMTDAGQVVAAYNGKNLYTAMYPQCRNAVRADCTDAGLQRAVTAYLMAVEQDCNTVQTMINEQKKKMTAAVREGGAMLDLARVENRQAHNADDMTACLNNVESAILSEEVCGAGYHKCLDNGEFIDITTGTPIAGVVKFYELEHLLQFNTGANIADQKLSKISSNRTFVQNFEKRVKKFAEPALDKCVEKSKLVWGDYLDKAMLDIYYAQKSKVAEIKSGCFDFVSSCYINADNALTKAMTELMGDAGIVLQPDKITVNSSVCREYVSSCNNMFDGDIVKQYIDERKDTDTLAACRAVVKQCFDKFGGAGYENFYYPFSGLFQTGDAASWFSLCEDKDCATTKKYKSECAKQLYKISSCSDHEMMEKAFGGLDRFPIKEIDSDPDPLVVKNILVYDTAAISPATKYNYGMLKNPLNGNEELDMHALRPSGVATEIYYQIIDTLKTQCNNVGGRFVELQFLKPNAYDPNNICRAAFTGGEYDSLKTLYGVTDGEDMCPRDYGLSVDIPSWGTCNCWENGARRSRWGTSVKCSAEIPTTGTDGSTCLVVAAPPASSNLATPPVGSSSKWCVQGKTSKSTQVCPAWTNLYTSDGKCLWNNGLPPWITDEDRIPKGIN